MSQNKIEITDENKTWEFHILYVLVNTARLSVRTLVDIK